MNISAQKQFSNIQYLLCIMWVILRSNNKNINFNKKLIFFLEKMQVSVFVSARLQFLIETLFECVLQCILVEAGVH